MEKNDAFSYNVHHDEGIAIKVIPRNFVDSLFSIRVVLDGNIFHQEPENDNAPVYKFTVSKDVDDIHTVMMEFTFVNGTPENALYDVAISGKNDQGCPCGFTIGKDNEDKSPDIEFVVAA